MNLSFDLGNFQEPLGLPSMRPMTLVNLGFVVLFTVSVTLSELGPAHQSTETLGIQRFHCVDSDHFS